MKRCARCERELAPAQEHYLPAILRVVTVYSFAFLHMGLFAGDMLSGPFCSRCRGIVSLQGFAATCVILTGVMLGALLIFGFEFFGLEF